MRMTCIRYLYPVGLASCIFQVSCATTSSINYQNLGAAEKIESLAAVALGNEAGKSRPTSGVDAASLSSLEASVVKLLDSANEKNEYIKSLWAHVDAIRARYDDEIAKIVADAGDGDGVLMTHTVELPLEPAVPDEVVVSSDLTGSVGKIRESLSEIESIANDVRLNSAAIDAHPWNGLYVVNPIYSGIDRRLDYSAKTSRDLRDQALTEVGLFAQAAASLFGAISPLPGRASSSKGVSTPQTQVQPSFLTSLRDLALPKNGGDAGKSGALLGLLGAGGVAVAKWRKHRKVSEGLISSIEVWRDKLPSAISSVIESRGRAAKSITKDVVADVESQMIGTLQMAQAERGIAPDVKKLLGVVRARRRGTARTIPIAPASLVERKEE